MKKNKIYKIRALPIIIDLFCSITIIVAFTVFSIWVFCKMEFSINNIGAILIFLSFVILMIGYYGFFSIYLCWIYYQREKNITVFIDYENKELQYIEQNKEIQYIKFEDIVAVENHSRYGIGVGYGKITLESGNSIIVTSLLIGNICKALPKKYLGTGGGSLLLPPFDS